MSNIRRMASGDIVNDTAIEEDGDENASPEDTHWLLPPISIGDEDADAEDTDKPSGSRSLPALPTWLTGSSKQDDSIDERSARRLGLRGNRLRSNGMFASRGVDSLTTPEIQSCYDLPDARFADCQHLTIGQAPFSQLPAQRYQ